MNHHTDKIYLAKIYIDAKLKAELHRVKADFGFDTMQHLYQFIFDKGVERLGKRVKEVRSEHRKINNVGKIYFDSQFTPEDLL
jgi:hypothetical protein